MLAGEGKFLYPLCNVNFFMVPTTSRLRSFRHNRRKKEENIVRHHPRRHALATYSTPLHYRNFPSDLPVKCGAEKSCPTRTERRGKQSSTTVILDTVQRSGRQRAKRPVHSTKANTRTEKPHDKQGNERIQQRYPPTIIS